MGRISQWWQQCKARTRAPTWGGEGGASVRERRLPGGACCAGHPDKAAYARLHAKRRVGAGWSLLCCRSCAPEPTVARSSIFFEAPKSASLTVPCLSIRILAPLMSLKGGG